MASLGVQASRSPSSWRRILADDSPPRRYDWRRSLTWVRRWRVGEPPTVPQPRANSPLRSRFLPMPTERHQGRRCARGYGRPAQADMNEISAETTVTRSHARPASQIGAPARPTNRPISFALVAGAAFALYCISAFVLQARDGTTYFGADTGLLCGARRRRCHRPHCAIPPDDGRHGVGLDENFQPSYPLGRPGPAVESDVCRSGCRRGLGRHVGFCRRRSAPLRGTLRDHLCRVIRCLVLLQHRGIENRNSLAVCALHRKLSATAQKLDCTRGRALDGNPGSRLPE